MKLIKK